MLTSHWIFRCLLVAWVGAQYVAADSPKAAMTSARPSLVDFKLPDSRGRVWTRDDFADSKLLVVAFLGTECPLAKLYAGTLESIRRHYADDGVAVLGVIANPQDSLAEMDAMRRRIGFNYELAKDLDGALAASLGATRSPEVFLVNSSGQIVYQGRIDDQYGFSSMLDEPRHRDLIAAIDESLAGKPISRPKTEPVGCLLGRSAKNSSPKIDGEPVPTFHGEVSAILNRRCVECHRAGEIGPFSLTDWDDASAWGDMMIETIDAGRMPPWHAGPDSAVRFANDRTMPAAEIETLRRWVDAGTPEGDEKPVVAPESAASTLGVTDEEGRVWQLDRQPDHVFSITPEPVAVQARGEVKYQYYKVDPKFDRDVWVSAMQLRPGNRSVVHHILVFAAKPGEHRSIQAIRSYLDGYVPGVRMVPFRKGYAKKIPAGSELIFQIHYTPTGTPQSDQSDFGLWEIPENEVTHEVFTDSIVEPRLKIPARAARFEVTANRRGIPAGAELLAVMPHMHVRGTAFRMELEPSNGWGFGNDRQVLLDVPNYDFNWQTSYVFDSPIHLPKGGWMHGTAWYDNSEKNLSNPDPDATVRWGDQTWEEMMIGYYHFAKRR